MHYSKKNENKMNQLSIEVSAVADFGDYITKGIYIGDTKQSIKEINKEFIINESNKKGFINFTIQNEYEDSFDVAYSGGLDQHISFTDIVLTDGSIITSDLNLRFSATHYANFLLSKGFNKLITTRVCFEKD
jgi:hypothetical protein